MTIGDHYPKEAFTLFNQERIPIVLWMTEDPFYTDVSALCVNDAHIILTIDEGTISFYQELGANHVHYLPIPVNTKVFTKKVKPCHEFMYDLALIGYPYPNRIRIINTLLNQRKWRILVAGKEWHRYLRKYQRRFNELTLMTRWLEPKETAALYQQTAIVLNPHRPANFAYNQNKLAIQNHSMNNRSFDIAASLSFQLTDMKPNHLFSSFVYYDNDEDLIRKVMYYLENEEKRYHVTLQNYEQVTSWNTFDSLPYRFNDILKSARL
ncbi:glycosyltransferase family protein [Bacillus sp. NPDC077027]|uniref:glycosyltransferase family protein n=1 Tax=Bacillus sp. NPDC077027 TaxID=3390548 RepID=UPI003D0285FB